MPQFTTEQISNIQRGNFHTLSEQELYYRDAKGNTLLHLLINANRPVAEIEAALAFGASPHLFNHNFYSPVRLALLKNKWDVAERLLQAPIVFPRHYFDRLLATLLRRYPAPSAANAEREQHEVTYLAARLCGEDMTIHFNQHKAKYLAHLSWFEGKNAEGVDLEGFWSRVMLPMRLWTILHLWAKVKVGTVTPPPLCTPDAKGDELETRGTEATQTAFFLRRDVLQTWQTLMSLKIQSWISQAVAASATQKTRLFQTHAQGIGKTVANLAPGESLVLAYAWYFWQPGKDKESGHATYCQVRKTTPTSWQLLFHNLGDGYPDHHPVIRIRS